MRVVKIGGASQAKAEGGARKLTRGSVLGHVTRLGALSKATPQRAVLGGEGGSPLENRIQGGAQNLGPESTLQGPGPDVKEKPLKEMGR